MFTRTGLQVAKGYSRIVIGGRGPYVEFSDDLIDASVLFVPKDQEYRLTHRASLYDEWRTNDSANVKFYHQKGTVGYANYLVKMWYASPFDLYDSSGTVLIDPIRKNQSEPEGESIFD